MRRTLPDIAFFQLPIQTSIPTPLHPAHNESLRTDGVKPFSPIQSRRALFKRLDHLDDFGSRKRSPQHSPAVKRAETDPSEQLTETDEKQPRLKEGEAEDLHWEAIERILFIFAKLNPGIGYIQGMNEILAPLYYVIANDTDEEARGQSFASLSLEKGLTSYVIQHTLRPTRSTRFQHSWANSGIISSGLWIMFNPVRHLARLRPYPLTRNQSRHRVGRIR